MTNRDGLYIKKPGTDKHSPLLLIIKFPVSSFAYFSRMKKWVYLSIHISGWLLFLANNSIEFFNGHEAYFDKPLIASGVPGIWFGLIFHSGHLLVLAIAFYGAYFFVGPMVLVRKNYLLAILCLLLVSAAVVFARWLVEFHLLLPVLHFDNYPGESFQLWYYTKNCLLYTYKFFLMGLVTYFIVASNRMEKEKKEIEKEKIQAELSFLKSQINPHFLFNTINDIYALTYQKDDQAPEALLKLSSILRYMLREGSAGKVSLQKELAYLTDYIELQRIGLKGKLYLDFTIEGKIDDQEIPPLLLIPFAENIFKHGVVDNPASPARMNIKINNTIFSMECSNSVRPQQKDNSSGIGLNNVRRRMELLFPDNYNFTIHETGDQFGCRLQLNLGSPVISKHA